jgi:hypothetical protein
MMKFFRYAALKAAGLVNNWGQLKKLVEEENFPPGRLIGPNTRVWTEEEIQAWIASRPTARKAAPPPPRPGSRPRGRPRKIPITEALPQG